MISSLTPSQWKLLDSRLSGTPSRRRPAHQIPLVCEYAEFDGEDLTDCEQLLQTEKEFYIFKIRHEFRPEAERKGKWYFYIGICKKHFKQALASEQFTARSFNRTKKVRNPQKVEIANVWKVTAVRSPHRPKGRRIRAHTSKSHLPCPEGQTSATKGQRKA